jgi:hypothetical protein
VSFSRVLLLFRRGLFVFVLCRSDLLFSDSGSFCFVLLDMFFTVILLCFPFSLCCYCFRFVMFASVVVVYFVTILVSICLLLFSWFVSSFVRLLLFRRRAFLFVSVVSVVFPIVDCVGGAAGCCIPVVVLFGCWWVVWRSPGTSSLAEVWLW